MNESEQKLSRTLARSLDEIAAKSLEVSIDELLSEYESVEQAFLPQVANNPFLVSETHRRVAEMKFYSAVDRNVAYEICRNLFSDLLALGFTNLEKKSNLYLIFARYCLQVGKEDEAMIMLREICTDLENALCGNDSLVYQEILRQARNLLTALD